MISQAEITNHTVVLDHVLAQLLHTRLVLEVQVAFDEAFVEFHDLAQGQVFSRGLVQPSDGLNDLESMRAQVASLYKVIRTMRVS